MYTAERVPRVVVSLTLAFAMESFIALQRIGGFRRPVIRSAGGPNPL